MSEPIPKFILASASPRRAEILRALDLAFEVRISSVPEDWNDGEPPVDYVMRVARRKAEAVAASLDAGLVVGADTAVVVDGRPLGKPTSPEDAAAMLRSLSGRWHAVMTGVVLVEAATRKTEQDHEKTLVRFRPLDSDDIARYVGTGEPLDKAGAYGIQGRGMLFVEEIAGNYHNVMGFPPNVFARLARRFGYSI